jgi:hypothetical protein
MIFFAAYIPAAAFLSSFTSAMLAPPISEVQTAEVVLSQSPVLSYSSFSTDEVEIIGKYREMLAPRALTNRTDDFWEAIVTDEWYAWLVAVHEAAEVDAFIRIGINPFDSTQLDLYSIFNNLDFATAHIEASLIELQYIQDWAKQLNRDTSYTALALQHPINKVLNPNYRQFVKTLQTREGWPDPTQQEMDTAGEVWNAIRRRQVSP